MFKFLHTADIHLDSPQLNLDQYDGAPTRLRNPTRRAFDNIIELAIREQVRFVLIAGDLYDGDSRDFQTPLHFRRMMNQLGEHDIRVFIIQGNHDAESKMRKSFRLQLPDNVTMLDTVQAETHRMDDLQVAIHGQGFHTRDVAVDLSQQYPAPVRGWLNIGMLHSSCGSYEAHARYAPSTVAGLTSKGYEYWALGHIHKREKLAGPDPWIIYPGNPQGRHIRESGPRGCVVATVDADHVTKTQWHDMDVVRWQVCEVDATDCEDADAVTAEAQRSVECLLAEAAGRPMAIRVAVRGVTKAHRDLLAHADHWDRRLRSVMLDHFDDQVWIERIKIQTQAMSDPVAWHADNPISQLLEGIADPELLSIALADVSADYEQLWKHVPTDPRLLEPAISLNDPQGAHHDELLSSVRDLLIARLFQPGDGS